MNLFGIGVVAVYAQRCFDRLKTVLQIALLETDERKIDLTKPFHRCL